ncbi:hypothetical protein [Rhizobium gallicum]|uniref:hypothetical protein n=1 Tax=Rhizobium gallicum TaxID=56730 RepID=UPI000AED7A4F|nr:hypothetical protein [Rhizobium gallicum]
MAVASRIAKTGAFAGSILATVVLLSAGVFIAIGDAPAPWSSVRRVRDRSRCRRA